MWLWVYFVSIYSHFGIHPKWFEQRLNERGKNSSKSQMFCVTLHCIALHSSVNMCVCVCVKRRNFHELNDVIPFWDFHVTVQCYCFLHFDCDMANLCTISIIFFPIKLNICIVSFCLNCNYLNLIYLTN